MGLYGSRASRKLHQTADSIDLEAAAGTSIEGTLRLDQPLELDLI